MIRFKINDLARVIARDEYGNDTETTTCLVRYEKKIIVQKVVQSGCRVKQFIQFEINILPKGIFLVDGDYLYILDLESTGWGGSLAELFGPLPCVNIDDPRDRKEK